MERLLNVRSPWLVSMNPVYAIAGVQRIKRRMNIEDHLLMSVRRGCRVRVGMQKPDANSDRLKCNSRTPIVGDEIVWDNTANAVGCKIGKTTSRSWVGVNCESRETAIQPRRRQLIALNFATIAVMSSCCS
jgi:hypothetical protein